MPLEQREKFVAQNSLDALKMRGAVPAVAFLDNT
jgi:hypothetical protein